MDTRYAERQRNNHTRWLKRHGLNTRPWLIFGSAPDPTVPESIAQSHARIDINNAGATAQKMGLGKAAITIRTHRKSWAEHPTLDSDLLLWVYPRLPLLAHAELLTKKKSHVGSLRTIKPEDRAAIVEKTCKSTLAGQGDLSKATNGIFAACYGLWLGVPEVVLCGISLSSAGHSYDTLGRERKQVAEDRFVLDRMKDTPNLFTTEARLADDAGLKLWRSSK